MLKKTNLFSDSFTIKENNHFLTKRFDFSYIDMDAGLITLITSDITDVQQKQIEQETQLREALEAANLASLAKSEFLSRMSHEIRTPMNAIIGLDTIALQEKNLSSSMEDHLKKIGISARFLLSLINDILDMSRIESGKMLLKNDNFDFRKMIDSINAIIYSQCKERGIDYECVIKDYIEEEYIGDVTKLQQVLLNILGNAVKFTDKGGKIHFMIEQVSTTVNNAKIKFCIADTGKGIDQRYIPHIFDTFSQEDSGATAIYGGTGLGLAISKHLVEMMDGNISVNSIKGMGTDFNVELSLGLSENTTRWNMIKPIKNFSAIKTLIVDDDVIVCEHTKVILSQVGIVAQWVDSGIKAVEQVKERHLDANDFDLIILDWKMPDMDGITTTRQIRKVVGPDVTIIMLTAYDWAEIEEKARVAGVDCFIRKPVFASSILEAYEDKVSGTKKDLQIHKSYNFDGKTILLVEDNLINAEIAQNLLEMAGFNVDCAHNGVEAIQHFSANKPFYYAAILMDIRMPIMDGLEAAKVLRSVHKEDATTIPIIAMSANAFEEDISKSLQAGMNAHLSKPVEADVLYETLRQAIYQKDKEK